MNVKLMRDGKEIERAVKVGEMEKKEEITPEIARDLGLKRETGVVVIRVEPGSSADEAGIQTGDVIQEVNRKPVKDVEDFMQKIDQAKSQDNVLLLIQRGQNSLFAAVTPN